MLAPAVDIVMVGSSAVAGCCCAVATTPSNTRTRALALTMPLAMAVAMFTEHVLIAAVLGTFVLGLSATLLKRPTPIDLHRSLGGGLMAVLVFVHLGVMSLMEAAGATEDVRHQMHPVEVEHGFATHLLVALAMGAVVVFLAWTVREVGLMRRTACARAVAGEFVSMGVSVAAMAIGVILMMHSMHG